MFGVSILVLVIPGDLIDFCADLRDFFSDFLNKAMKVLLICALFGAALSEVYFEEKFGAGWEDRWVQSTHKGADAGKFVLSAGKFHGDAELDQGIQTSQDAKFYALSAEFKPFSNV